MARKSIVLVTVDCLRADHVGFMGYPRLTTPFLDSLAAESFVFSAAIVTGTPTYYSFPGIMASRYPLALGRDVVGLAPDEPCLASALRKAGYATAAFTAANPYLAPRFGYDQGFDTFCDFLEVEVEPLPLSDQAEAVHASKGWMTELNTALQRARLGPLRIVYDELYFRYCQRITPVPGSLDDLRRFPAADAVMDRACEWMNSTGDQPIFLWLHLMDPHAPYYPKPEALEMMGESPVTPFRARYLNSRWNRSDLGLRRLSSGRDEMIQLYDAGIRWVDEQLSRLSHSLRKSRRWDDCVFVVSADHGEEFLDHDGRFHPPSRLTEELIRVPLLVRAPGNIKPKAPTAPFSMLDLAPTLLDVAELKAPLDFEGTSRWPELREAREYESVTITESVAGCTNPFRREGRLGPRALAVREKRFKLIFHFDQRQEDLYDLEADPGEQSPLAPSSRRAERRRLLEVARRHVQNSAKKRNLQSRMRARIRDLQLESARLFPQKVS